MTPGSVFRITYPNGMVVGSDAASFIIANSNGFHNGLEGTYTFIVSEVANSCVGETASFKITVNPEPVAVAGNDGDAICGGDEKTLAADYAGPGATYAWYLDGGDGMADLSDDTFISNDQNPTVSPMASSDYFVMITSATGCSATSSMTSVTVNEVDDPTTAGDQEICEFENLATPLSATTTATDINWYDAAAAGNLLGTGNNFTPSGTNALAAGTHSFFAESIDDDGCVSGRLEVVLTVNDGPNAPHTGDLTICSGSTVPTVTPVGETSGSVFRITYPNGTVVGADAASFNIASGNGFDNSAAGTYTFLLSEISANDCVSPSYSFDVTVEELPMLTIGNNGNTVCQGSSTTLFATTVMDATYAWYVDGGDNVADLSDDILVSTDMNPVVSPMAESDYFYVVTSPQGCEGISACLLYTSPSPRDATLSRMPSSA